MGSQIQVTCDERDGLTCCCEHTDPALDLTGSGTALLVGVVAMQGSGDLGVPGVFKVGVVGMGDMGLEPTSSPPSRHPGVLLPPSLLPGF